MGATKCIARVKVAAMLATATRVLGPSVIVVVVLATATRVLGPSVIIVVVMGGATNATNHFATIATL
jgi:hypothetical protein